MQPARLRLGQLLVDAHILSAEQLERVLTLQKSDGRRLGTLLVENEHITETQLTQILSQQLSVPWVSLYHIDFSRHLLGLIPREIAEKYCLVPIYVRPVRRQGDTLTWQATVEDPDVLMKPWTMNRRVQKLNPDPKATLPESLPCVERDLSHLVTKEHH